LIAQLDITGSRAGPGDIQLIAGSRKIVALEEHSRQPVARTCTRWSVRMLDDQALQVPLGPCPVPAHHLELGEADQGIFGTCRKWVLDDDAEVIALGVLGTHGSDGAPEQALRVCR
jgi:hypothetical protein